MSTPHDENTAYHEAGHAVVALALDRPVHRVSVLPTQAYLGTCEFRKGVFRPSKDWLENEILIALAGPASEARQRGKYEWGGAGRDLRVAEKLCIMRAGERQAEKLARRMLAKVENLLAEESLWRAVELIVAELMQKGEITGRAARHLFDLACKEE